MKKNDNTPKTREQIFTEKADNYGICYSTICPLREHCLHSILANYKPQDREPTFHGYVEEYLW